MWLQNFMDIDSLVCFNILMLQPFKNMFFKWHPIIFYFLLLFSLGLKEKLKATFSVLHFMGVTEKKSFYIKFYILNVDQNVKNWKTKVLFLVWETRVQLRGGRNWANVCFGNYPFMSLTKIVTDEWLALFLNESTCGYLF